MKRLHLGFLGSLTLLVLLLAAHPAWAEEAAAEAEGIPTSVIYAIINFVILAGGLFYLLRKPAKEYFASRSALIKTTMDQAGQLKSQAEKKYSEYEKRMKTVDGDMKSLVDQLKTDGELERQKIVEQAQRQAEILKDTSGKILNQELRKAKEDLKREATTLASEMAEKMVRENITAQDQKRIVEQYLQKMEKVS